MSESTETLVPGETPAPIWHAGLDNESGATQNMDQGDWLGTTWLEDVDGNLIFSERPVTEFRGIVNADGVTIQHFLAEMSVAEAKLMVLNADRSDKQYRWHMRVSSVSEPYADITSKLITVSASAGDIAPVSEESSTTSPDPLTGTSIFDKPNPTALPERGPTAEEAEKLALIGDLWVDQVKHPGQVDIPDYMRVYYWLHTQSNQTRNAVNALLARSSNSGQVEAEFEAWKAADSPSRDTATIGDWLSSFINSNNEADASTMSFKV